MTIHKNTSKVSYVGNGVQTEYQYQFKIYNFDNLQVYIDGVQQVLDTDYTMTNTGTEDGGTVTFTVAPADGAMIVMERILTYQQLLDLIPYDKFPAESVEGGMDYLCMLIQQNESAISRSITLPVGSDADLTFPSPGAGEFIKYTNDGEALETSDLTNLGVTVIPSMTNQEVIDGTSTADRLVSAADLKLSVETHQSAAPSSVFDVDYIEVVDTLPGTPVGTTLYLVRE
jgi:hypothetical protein